MGITVDSAELDVQFWHKPGRLRLEKSKIVER